MIEKRNRGTTRSASRVLSSSLGSGFKVIKKRRAHVTNYFLHLCDETRRLTAGSDTSVRVRKPQKLSVNVREGSTTAGVKGRLWSEVVRSVDTKLHADMRKQSGSGVIGAPEAQAGISAENLDPSAVLLLLELLELYCWTGMPRRGLPLEPFAAEALLLPLSSATLK